MNVQDLAQGILDIGLECKSYGVSWIAISSILTRSSAQMNQVIAKVNDLLNHFSPVSDFCTPWKRQKTFGFLTFSGGIEMWHWTEMG